METSPFCHTHLLASLTVFQEYFVYQVLSQKVMPKGLELIQLAVSGFQLNSSVTVNRV